MEAPWMILLLASAALLVRVGQALAAMGMVRAKNVASAGFRNLADLCVAILAFWALGAAIFFQQNNPIFGIRLEYLIGWSGLSSNWIGVLPLILIATGIVVPALAERSKLLVPLATGALVAALIVPLIAHWTGRGWLSRLGFIDLAGAAPIHLAPAVCAAVAAVFVGAREGKYNRDGSSNMIPGHSILMILLSVLLMFVGWIPYVGLAAVNNLLVVSANVLVAAAAGGLTSLIVGHIRFGKADVLLTCCGFLGGLVSITAAAGEVRTPGAFFIGAVAGLIIPWMTVAIDLRWKIDDPGGVVAVHGAGGIWSLMAAGIFSAGSFLERFKTFGVQLLGILVTIILAGAFCAALMILLKSTVGLRSKDADEYDGLDLAEHDINAHPDFQQTMIKSYHLREA